MNSPLRGRCDFPGCACVGPCLPGGTEADLLSGASQIRDTCPRGIPPSESQRRIAKSLGIPKDNIYILQSGDVLELDDQQAKVVDHVHTGAILVDGLGVGDVGNIVLRDRQHLAEDGILIVVLTLERFSNQLLAGPDIVSRGFVYVRESEGLMDEARRVVENALDNCMDKHITDWGKIKNVTKDALSDFLWKKTKRNPMILPIIMEV